MWFSSFYIIIYGEGIVFLKYCNDFNEILINILMRLKYIRIYFCFFYRFDGVRFKFIWKLLISKWYFVIDYVLGIIINRKEWLLNF